MKPLDAQVDEKHKETVEPQGDWKDFTKKDYTAQSFQSSWDDLTKLQKNETLDRLTTRALGKRESSHHHL